MAERISRLMLSRISRQALLLTLLLGRPIVSSAVALTTEPTKDETTIKVLILSSYEPASPGSTILSESCRATLRKRSPVPVRFYNEFLDSSRIAESKYEAITVGSLRQKYEAEQLDLIFVLGVPALKLLLQHKADLFPRTPEVFCFFEETEAFAEGLGPGVTGVRAKLEYGKTLEVALALHPKTEKVFVVTGSSGQDRYLSAEAEKEFRNYNGRTEFTYLSDLTVEELQQKLATLPNNSVVIFLSFFLDSAGNTFSGPEGASLVASSSSAPVYGIAKTYLGTGIVGGSLFDFEALGVHVGELGLRVLGGQGPEDFAPQTMPNVTTFDARALRRWGVSEKSLPPGSLVEFREQPFWEHYKWYIVAIIGVSFIEALLIAGLLINRARRRQAEGVLRQSEERRLLAQRAGRVGTWEWDITTGKSTWSEGIYELLGLEQGDGNASVEDFIEFIHPEDRGQALSKVESAIKGGEDYYGEFRIIRRDGTILWLASKGRVVNGVSGNARRMIGVNIDITNRKLAEEALRQSERRQLDILRALPDLVFVQSPDGIYLDYYADDKSDLYVPPDVFIGKSVRDVLPTDLAEAFLCCFRRAEETGELQIHEYTLPMRGEQRWYEARIIYTNDGKFLSIVRDVTERKMAEGAVRESQAQLAEIIGSAMDAIITVGNSKRIILFNTAAEQMFRCSAQEMIGRSLDLFIPEWSRERCQGIARDFLKSGKANFFIGVGESFYARRADGEEFPFEASVSQTELGGLKYYTIIVRDITERRKAENALKESEANYRSIFNGINAAIFVLDKKTGAVLEVNQKMREMYGFTAEEARSVRASDVSANESYYTQEVAMDLIRKATAGEPQLFEWRAKDKQGRLFWAEVSLIHVTLEGKERVLSVVRDITDRKRAEEAREEAFAQVIDLKSQLEAENIYLKEEIKLEQDYDEIVGKSEAIRNVLFKLERVAHTNITVLIMGETGTGKELVARAIHNTSVRKDKPLIKVNCATLPAALIESELFGHERGAFTGATARRLGRFELANGGTIFLDEIGELPLELQSKLLRVLEEGEFERLGSEKTVKVNARVIAATNRDLPSEIKRGLFREDLWYRLNAFLIQVPSLRERKEDIPLLVQAFMRKFSKELGKNIKGITPAAMRALQEYAWPGNVRELSNVIERAVINTEGEILRLVDRLDRARAIELPAARQTLDEVERQYILRILEETAWRIEGSKGAARILGLNPSTLRTRMVKLGIQKPTNGSQLDLPPEP